MFAEGDRAAGWGITVMRNGALVDVIAGALGTRRGLTAAAPASDRASSRNRGDVAAAGEA